MICLGYAPADKAAEIARAIAEHGAARVVILSPAKFRFALDLPTQTEWIEWAEIIEYRTYYRLLQEIGRDTLVIVNECLRTQNRHELTYNCIRLFLQQAGRAIVFQYLPLIDTPEDFGVLFDFATRSQWKREPWSRLPLSEARIKLREVPLSLRRVDVPTDAKTRSAYAKEKRKLIDGIGLRDPHTIPRRLHLMSGRAKLAHVHPERAYVGRNNRYKVPNMATYREPAYPHAPYTVFELPHNFIDFSDVVALSEQPAFDALVSDLRVDAWYYDRYSEWTQRIRDAYTILRG